MQRHIHWPADLTPAEVPVYNFAAPVKPLSENPIDQYTDPSPTGDNATLPVEGVVSLEGATVLNPDDYHNVPQWEPVPKPAPHPSLDHQTLSIQWDMRVDPSLILGFAAIEDKPFVTPAPSTNITIVTTNHNLVLDEKVDTVGVALKRLYGFLMQPLTSSELARISSHEVISNVAARRKVSPTSLNQPLRIDQLCNPHFGGFNVVESEEGELDLHLVSID